MNDALDNPYRSPEASVTLPWPVPHDPAAPLLSTLIERQWRYRRIRFQGRIETEIEWNARWPLETIRVSGRRAAAQHAFWYVRHFEFALETSLGSCRMTIDIALRFTDFFGRDAVRSLKICLDDEVAYIEDG